MTIEQIILSAAWFVAPAYATNGFPPLLKGKRSLDRNRYFGKNRILGDGKTFEGTIGGIVFGLIIGSVEIFFQETIKQTLPLNLILFPMTFSLVLAIVLGSMFGDIFGSFIKRRLSIVQGASFPGLDQLGFLIFAVIFSLPLYAIGLQEFIFLVIITPIFHLTSNIIAHRTKLKKVPW